MAGTCCGDGGLDQDLGPYRACVTTILYVGRFRRPKRASLILMTISAEEHSFAVSVLC